MIENVLVFGANGQLGNCLKRVVKEFSSDNFNFIYLIRQDFDITNIEILKSTILKFSPSYIINCAAYTNVDLAEEEKDLAYNINTIGAKNLAQVCSKYNCTLIHISTDFVFEGKLTKLLNETTECRPINYYGDSKLQGEQEIKNNLEKYFILRTSWLYSEYGSNFVKTMLRLGSEKKVLQVVNDQIGTPTYAVDFAEVILGIVLSKSEKYGVYHYSNEGVASWYDFAKAIFEYSNNKLVNVIPVSSEQFITKAIRPSFSVLNKEKIKTSLNIEIPYWRNSLKKCLKKIN